MVLAAERGELVASPNSQSPVRPYCSTVLIKNPVARTQSCVALIVGGKFREVTVALLSEHPSCSPVFRKPLLAWPCGASLGVSWSSEHPLCFPDVKMSLSWDHNMQGKSVDVMVTLSSQGPFRRLTIMKGNFVDVMVALTSEGPSRCIHAGDVKRKAPR